MFQSKRLLLGPDSGWSVDRSGDPFGFGFPDPSVQGKPLVPSLGQGKNPAAFYALAHSLLSFPQYYARGSCMKDTK